MAAPPTTHGCAPPPPVGWFVHAGPASPPPSRHMRRVDAAPLSDVSADPLHGQLRDQPVDERTSRHRRPVGDDPVGAPAPGLPGVGPHRRRPRPPAPVPGHGLCRQRRHRHRRHRMPGDLPFTDNVIPAGTGFRTATQAHDEAQETFGRPVVSLQLVDPRFYHLDTALVVLRDDLVAYYPPAFSPGSAKVIEHLYPEAIVATEADSAALGLNAVSDGTHVIHAPGATDLAAAVRERGMEPIAEYTSELRKGGGGAKCCTLELRTAPIAAAA